VFATCVIRTRNRSAPASWVGPRPPLESLATTNAAPLSRASRVSRTAIARGSTGAESRITSANAPLRSSTSAHQAPRAASCGRITQIRPVSPTCVQSRGESVRLASTTATQPPSAIVHSTTPRRRLVLPLPRNPTISVSRPRGMPPDATASSSEIPVESTEPAGVSATPTWIGRGTARGASNTATDWGRGIDRGQRGNAGVAGSGPGTE
jgi:hypothetical protein